MEMCLCHGYPLNSKAGKNKEMGKKKSKLILKYRAGGRESTKRSSFSKILLSF